MAGLLKEIWINQLLKNMYPDTSFLNYANDLSALVEYNKINLAEAGVDPDVFVNNTTYPIGFVKDNPTPISIELDKFETENSLVRRPEYIQFSFDQLEGVIYGHRQSLRTSSAKKAAHAFAPQSNTSLTPVLSTTGETVAGKKSLSINDILDLKQKYDDMDYPNDHRYLVLAPSHVNDLIRADLKAFKNITDFENGEPKRLAGFNILTFTKNPVYNTTTMQKVAWGAASAGTDGVCSFSFYKDEVMKADGDIFMYLRENDPEQRGSIIGFDKRFVAVPYRNKGIGAIVTVPA